MLFTVRRSFLLATLLAPIIVKGNAVVDTSEYGFFDSIISQLRPLLSANAVIYLPNSTNFTEANARWSEYLSPDYRAIVAVACEQDIVETIRYANAHQKPFLTIGGAHGATLALRKLEDGIGIWTRPMAGVEVSSDGTAAKISAGTLAVEVQDALWEQGKTAATTAGDCIGFFGPALGGGHGFQQGELGLLIDNVLSYRVILADGTAITASVDEHFDLFWAMRGAGHNYGVVASLEYRIFDRKPETEAWSYEQYAFSGEQLEAVYEQASLLLRRPGYEPPAELTHYGFITWTATEPVLGFFILWHGSSIPSQYTQPFRSIGPTSITSNTTDIRGINVMVGGAEIGSPFCTLGGDTFQFPSDINAYNTTAIQQAYDFFSSLPSWLHGSAILLEGYSTTAVQAVPYESTAYPMRSRQLLVSPVMSYAEGTGNYSEAVRYGEEIRKVFLDGSGQRWYAYVNYAHGNEPLQAVYGYEPWRLQKLRRLKKKYDPQNKFGFFDPVD